LRLRGRIDSKEKSDPATRDDTSLEYSTVIGVTSQIADLIGGALRYLAAAHSYSGEFSGLPTRKRSDYN
jgi:hypothetical protein